MKIFLDTANLDAVKKWAETGLIDGVTTNPTHLSKEGKDPKKQVLALCKAMPDGYISVEVTEKEPQKVYAQAKKIAALSENIVVKIPCHKDYVMVINKLVQDDVPLNITLVFTLPQALLMSKLGVDFISPFIGRWDDSGVDGSAILEDMQRMVIANMFDTEIIAASIRDVRHFHAAIAADVDVVTLPAEVLEKSLGHILTDQGIERFDADWKKIGIKQFP
ncbi:fructose-6-phosphate aldolase [Candidatus Dependentiae bacterium HGW-Dependentiae-1]|nr:MAG: fructose-6-phosphate aldolase [Candidatus Dependentiae bacterium HGW-Dependentiae-1]